MKKTLYTIFFSLVAGLVSSQTVNIDKPPYYESYILTPEPSPKPKINCAKVLGVRPGKPVIFTIPATGRRPMTFSAYKIPDGLSLDGKTGVVLVRMTPE